MTKATVRRASPRRGATRATPTRHSAWKGWAIGAVVIAALTVVAIFVFQAANRRTEEDPAVTAIARENAGGDVRVLTGTHHTVYHSESPLPTPQAPRSDGKPTLVWFSGTWCEFCEQMDPFAHETARSFADRAVFVEKSVDDDRAAAARYGIRGTPTFVLIDAKGKELGRFGFQPTAVAFNKTIASLLARAGL